MNDAPLVSVRGLKVWFPITAGVLRRTTGHVKAVDGVDLDVAPGETLGIVGESGCGKSTLLRALLRLVEPTDGDVTIDGTDVRALDRAALRRLRGDVQLVFQDPFASLNPRMSIGQILAEPLQIHRPELDANQRQARVRELLELVRLVPEHASRYPNEFSGGQRQRIGIARALAADPKLVLLDEPVSALDVSIQSQVLGLLDELRGELGLSYVFVSHDLSVVRHVADRVMVMYLGKTMEVGEAAAVVDNPQHPYSRALLSAVPVPDPVVERRRRADRVVLSGDLPSPANPPAGCVFHTRCPVAMDRCATDPAPLQPNGVSRTACWAVPHA